MNAEKYIESVLYKSDKDYGIFIPPTKAQEGLHILIHHFLGDDWYTVNPISRDQVNTEAIYEILKRYPEHKTFKERAKRLLKL